MDARFTMAVHILILISEADTPLSSTAIAKSVGTNASFVRKVIGSLKRDGIVDARQGVAGYRLLRAPEELRLDEVYRSVSDDGEKSLIPLHKNPNDQCVVGRYIAPTMQPILDRATASAIEALSQVTLADCIADMRGMLERGTTEHGTL